MKEHHASRRLQVSFLAVLFTAVIILSGCGLLFETGTRIKPHGYALVYGIANYAPLGVYDPENEFSNDLTVTDDDAVAMADLLQAQGYTVYKAPGNDQATRLGLEPNVAVTKAQIEADFAEVRGKISEDDTFIMYYSGHGTQSWYPGDESATNITSTGYDTYDEGLALSNYPLVGEAELLTDDELAGLFRTIPAKKKILILDSCNSGGFIGAGPTLDTNPQNYGTERGWDGYTLSLLFNQFTSYDGSTGADVLQSDTIVLAASGEQELSWEETENINHGIFTYFFLDAPQKADANLDGYVSLRETFRFVSDRIEAEWNTIYPRSSYLPRISGTPVDFILFTAAE